MVTHLTACVQAGRPAAFRPFVVVGIVTFYPTSICFVRTCGTFLSILAGGWMVIFSVRRLT